MERHDTIVFIGRFQPFHNGHAKIINEALKLAKREVIVVVGSSNQARSMRNPFTFEERKEMIKSIFPNPKLKIVPVMDYPYDENKWLIEVKSAVFRAMDYTPDPTNTSLIGFSKDHTSYYLKRFDGWSHIDCSAYSYVNNIVNATDLRNLLLSGNQNNHYLEDVMHESVLEISKRVLEENPTLQFEYDLIKKYKSQFDGYPFGPPKFFTADAVVHRNGKILLVKRKSSPGMGLWALPGGFVNPFEEVKEAAYRELKEETNIDLPLKILIGSTVNEKVFDSPYRSDRGRTITVAQYIDLGFSEKLPKIRAADDAEDCAWVELCDLKPEEMFEDHYHIINHFLNVT